MLKSALVVFGCLLVISCSSVDRTNQTIIATQMRTARDSLMSILPYAFDQSKFENKKNNKMLVERMSFLSKAIHDMPKKEVTMLLGQDPFVSLNLQELGGGVDRALESFKKGRYSYSRHLLKHSLSYCFACHTRSDVGEKYDKWNLGPFKNLELTSVERTNLLIATRQFSQAKKYIETHLSGKYNPEVGIYAYEKMIKSYMVIALKVDENPKEGYDFLTRLEYKLSLPVYLSANIKNWKKSLMRWTTEKKNRPKVSSLSHAKKLIDRSDKSEDFFGQRDKYVDYLRASSVLQKELKADLNGKKKAEIYYYLGTIYSYMSDFDTWGLPENYFEECIRGFPKSDFAKKCYKNYEAYIFLGYSGSSGTFIPHVESEKLDELKNLSGYSSSMK